jgi:hypothetical protein
LIRTSTPFATPAWGERLDDALVGVVQVHVLAAHGDLDALRHRVDLLHHPLPFAHIGGRAGESELLADDVVESLLAKDERHLVDRGHVARLDHLALGDVAEERDLAADVVRERPLGAADEDIRLDADRQELFHAVLRRFRLELARRLDVGHEREVHVQAVLAAHLEPELADRLEERQPLDVARRPADLGDDDVDVVAVLGGLPDAGLDLVGDVRDDLNGPPEVAALALAVDDGLVDLSGGHVRTLAQAPVDEPLVVPEIEIRLGAVVGDVDLAVLERAHRAGIDVEIGIEFLEDDAQAALFEEEPDRRARDPFSERRHHPARHEDVFRLLAHADLGSLFARQRTDRNTAHHSSGSGFVFQRFSRENFFDAALERARRAPGRERSARSTFLRSSGRSTPIESVRQVTTRIR